jgi:signal transduction histidine kinase
VDYRPGALHLEVMDDGPGTTELPNAASGGHGLLAMRERVGLVGGSVVAGPRPSGGWSVSARLPLESGPMRMAP